MKKKFTQSVNNGQGPDRSNTNVISVSGYSRNLSQLNSPIENSSMMDNYIRVNMNMNDDFTITLVGLYISLIVPFQMKGYISFYFLIN